MERYAGSGRIELCVDNSWGTICSNSWDDIDASVACNQLGYSLYGKIDQCTASTGQVLVSLISINEQQSECVCTVAPYTNNSVPQLLKWAGNGV